MSRFAVVVAALSTVVAGCGDAEADAGTDRARAGERGPRLKIRDLGLPLRSPGSAPGAWPSVASADGPPDALLALSGAASFRIRPRRS
ncbi:MAG: hypothetical protein ACPGPE_16215 [Planctomycetota bacterium]